MRGGIPACLYRLMLLMLGVVIHIASMVSPQFHWPQWDEDVLGENIWLRLLLGVIDSLYVVSFFALLLVWSIGFCVCLSYSHNYSVGGGAVIAVMAVSLLAALFLRIAVKLCSTHVYTPYRQLYRSWRFLLVSIMFWTVRVHFRLLLADTKLHPTKWALVVSSLQICSVAALVTLHIEWCSCILTSEIQSSLTRASEIVGDISYDKVTTAVTIMHIYRNHTKHLTCTDKWAVVAPNKRKPWIHYV
jgi:hypothetical protein